MPRKPSCLCGDCPKCEARVKARARYAAMSVEERRAMVARRDRDAIKRNEQRRFQRDKGKRMARNREWVLANPEKAAEHKKRWAVKNPEKRRAHVAVSNAIRDGKLIKGPCARAAEGGCSERIQAHHDDYSKPLDVTWLCSTHHGETRRKAA